jgi:hypothetical protein
VAASHGIQKSLDIGVGVRGSGQEQIIRNDDAGRRVGTGLPLRPGGAGGAGGPDGPGGTVGTGRALRPGSQDNVNDRGSLDNNIDRNRLRQGRCYDDIKRHALYPEGR